MELTQQEDTERDLAELKARIAKTADFVRSFKPAQLEGTEDKDIVLRPQGREVTFKGIQYLHGFALQNFYFHLTAAYAILRQNGVEVGKRDYIGNP